MARQHLIAPFITTIALAGACGTEVTVLDDGTGGSTSSGGGMSPATTGQGGSTGVCPADLPADGALCSPEALYCKYEDLNECLLADATCSDGRWLVTHYDVECNPPACPIDKPLQQSPCEPYFEDLSCWYQSDWPCPGFEVEARCDEGQWQVAEPLCNPPPPDYCYSLTNDADCDNTGGLCRWRVPGCGPDPLPQAGCFPTPSCLDTPGLCQPNQTCTPVSIDPCWNLDCGQCHQATAVCL